LVQLNFTSEAVFLASVPESSFTNKAKAIFNKMFGKTAFREDSKEKVTRS
jgi:hypothetical protein